MEERLISQIRKKDERPDITLMTVASMMNSADGSFVAKSSRTADNFFSLIYSPPIGLGTLPETFKELRNLYKLSDVLGQAYEEAVRRIMERFPDCTDPDKISARAGRIAALSFLRPELRLRDAAYVDQSLPTLWRKADFIDYEELFNAAIYGHLSYFANVFLDQGTRKGEAVSDPEPECVLSVESGPRSRIIGNPVTSVEIWVGEHDKRMKGRLFLKTCSMDPDVFASRLLAGTGISVPETRTVWYNKPDGTEGQYGLVLDASQYSGDGSAFPLGDLVRLNQRKLASLKARLPELSKALGHAFEICRLRGIQDRHPKNTWIMTAEDSGIRIAMIDMDLVGCYPHDVMLYQQEFAAHMESIAAYLSKLLFVNNSGRISFGDIGKTLNAIKASFLEGAAEAHRSDKKRDFGIAEEFEIYDGKPVGIFCREENLMGRFIDSKAGCVTYNALNGPRRQQLIVGGPNSGRFRFDAGMAWEHGYSAQRAIKPRDFWEGVFIMAESFPVRSIVY